MWKLLNAEYTSYLCLYTYFAMLFQRQILLRPTSFNGTEQPGARLGFEHRTSRTQNTQFIVTASSTHYVYRLIKICVAV
jgi:hypothetical protein